MWVLIGHFDKLEIMLGLILGRVLGLVCVCFT